ncbi:MAG: tRNA (adenosine(37)-N6)-threonylcarbamoyltransferase complex transferase subunit TsaD [Patescibacteria group bacterium]|nr:tRNA (adenosine(37)-N6)-threonylcarbamoyltransferase complex transferase subunit TsaD [Patescibacteria group bacterium]
MRVLAVETSCDETAVCLIGTRGGLTRARLSLLGNSLYSQVALHAPFGGVFPSLAKREHAKNLVPLLEAVLSEATIPENEKIKKQNKKLQCKIQNYDNKIRKLRTILEREGELLQQLLSALPKIVSRKPPVNAIAVTYGPGLEPALWVGINFARALSVLWDVPSPITSYQLLVPKFPALALLVSGGHTELVLMRDWLDYRVVGETRDDAAGEAFDKVARMLGLPYPGGPEISRLAEKARKRRSEIRNQKSEIGLPRPMLHSPDFDFSFSGLKTAVLYLLKAPVQHRVLHKKVQHTASDTLLTKMMALEFENAVVEVLVAKTLRAAQHFGAHTVLLGGGVAANMHLRRELERSLMLECPKTRLLLPNPSLTGDNAIMIAAGAHIRLAKLGLDSFRVNPKLRAQGNLRLSS